ncbi:MAG: hypothetical protein DRQ39_10710 [Gammaproteobacteria bacterium]|nr:MAG: hypothetical protein DRQ39_10710 [Gammaproteobacteria bacterium]
MTLMVHAPIGANKEISGPIVMSDTAVAVPTGSVAIYTLSTVPTYRQLETVNGWRMLYNGIRDRNLLDVQFNGAVLYSGVSIDSTTENNRRTASEITSFNTDDVVVAIGAAATSVFNGAIEPLEAAMHSLVIYAAENSLRLA